MTKFNKFEITVEDILPLPKDVAIPVLVDRQRPSGKSSTYTANVHTVVWCAEEDCNFKADWYLDATKLGQEHYDKTGHEVRGEEGRAIWIGRQGRVYLKEKLTRILGSKHAAEVYPDV